MGELAGRVAWVTGSTSGIGLGVARALAAAGAEVIVHGLGSAEQVEAALAAVRAAGNAPVRFVDADLADADAIASALAAVGPVDILVNNAGIQHTAPLAELARSRFDLVLAINLAAPFQLMAGLLPGMAARGYGRVINIASVHGLVASVHKAPYVAAKHGLIGLSKVAALEYARAGDRASGGVTINSICPGWVETPLIEPQIAARAEALGVDRAAAAADMLREKQPSQRMSQPEDIAALVRYLCSREAHNVTGAALTIDGGWTAQ